MKKCLIIFTIAILSIIPSFIVSAFTGNDGVEYPETPDGRTNYIIYKRYDDNSIRMLSFTDNVKYVASDFWQAIPGSGYSSYNYVSLSLWLLPINTSDSVNCSSDLTGVCTTSLGYDNKADNADINYYKLVNNEWSKLTFSDNVDFGYIKKILYSTKNIYYRTDVAASIYPEDSYFIPGLHGDKEYPGGYDGAFFDLTYKANVVENKEYLTYSANKANDLDGIDIYNFRFNANNYNPSYKYLIKTEQQTEWTDITDELNNEAYQYDYMLYYNTTLYMQVLDENSEILETKTFTVNDLQDYGFNISHGAASDLNDRYINVITIDTRYIYESNYKYQYSYDNQVFYDMNITQDNKIFYLNHALNIPIYLRVLSPGGSTIYSQKYDVNFEDIDKNVLFYESTNISDNEKQIIIKVDFTEYLKFFDMYNFRIWINSVEYDEQTFIKEFISTEENYIKSIKIKIQVDNLTIEDFTYRVGTETGTSGGSDTDFDNMYDNVLENQLKNELKENDYTTVNGMVQAIKNFINAISEFVTVFFELIMYFFDKLNIWIRTCIIALFIELVIFKTIKAVRKK